MKPNEDEYCAAYDVFCKRTGGRLIVCHDGSVGTVTKDGWRWLFSGKHSYDCLTILGQSIRLDSDARMKAIIAKKILAVAQTNDVVSMTGTFIDTIVICTMTGLSIVITGAWQATDAAGQTLEGVNVTAYAFDHGLWFLPEAVSSFVLMMCLAFFAFTTILGWNYYSERCLEYLCGNHKKELTLKIFKFIYIAAIFISPYLTAKAVWNIADICNGLMAFPNLLALFLLSGIVAKETKDFIARDKFNSKREKLKKAENK